MRSYTVQYTVGEIATISWSAYQTATLWFAYFPICIEMRHVVIIKKYRNFHFRNKVMEVIALATLLI